MATITERLADLAGSAFLDTARITAAGRLSEHFVTLELQSPAFRTAEWTPGAKMQLRPARGTLSLRTYTPFGWDPEQGALQLLAYTHGAGPGSEWFAQARIGDDCELLGPRKSIDLRGLRSPVLFVGDESSVGLACALRSVAVAATHVVESAEPEELRTVLEDLGLGRTTTVVARTDGHEPLLDAARSGGEGFTTPFDLVVTGDATGVHAVRRDTRSWSRRPTRIQGKAYWATGRTGLD